MRDGQRELQGADAKHVKRIDYFGGWQHESQVYSKIRQGIHIAVIRVSQQQQWGCAPDVQQRGARCRPWARGGEQVLQALGSMPFPNIYPDPQSRLLRKALSEDVGVPAENLLVSWPLRLH